MANRYIHATALKVYAAIAASGDHGLDAEQLVQATGYARNTITSYGRWLKADQSIKIYGIQSDARNRALKNLYVAVREPRPQLNDVEKLRKIADTLEPYRYRGTGSWDARYKGEIEQVIDQAIGIARS